MKKITIITTFVVFIFIAGQVFISKNLGIYISNDNVILTFVGVLATFIVITNYYQFIETNRIIRQITNRQNEIDLKHNEIEKYINLIEKKFEEEREFTEKYIDEFFEKQERIKKRKEYVDHRLNFNK